LQNQFVKADAADGIHIIALYVKIITRASFCCSKILSKLHLFSTKVAFMRKQYKRQ